ncbi:hypothetical protein FIBSPDRAFT_875642 [Athelia psychrophila]|uniref:Uncharacterized protein n=1 Tax=Athelia psychrophila TaxID=1759441 RepID=A0A167XKH7_9AGAM|nr:hypothetical protein FIBSPDRAFT_875642 [Fibularhizoctonia sp. CBS 109695]
MLCSLLRSLVLNAPISSPVHSLLHPFTSSVRFGVSSALPIWTIRAHTWVSANHSTKARTGPMGVPQALRGDPPQADLGL